MSLPARYDMKVYRGEVWSEVFTMEDEAVPPVPVDLTGRAVSVVIASSGSVPEIDLTDGSGLTITPTTGQVAVNLTADQTRAMASTTWSLWLDKDTSAADVLVTGNVYVIGA